MKSRVAGDARVASSAESPGCRRVHSKWHDGDEFRPALPAMVRECKYRGAAKMSANP